MTTADETFAEAARHKLRLCNLFQFNEAGRWRANWIRDGLGQPFGEGSSPQAALAEALTAALPSRYADDIEDLL